MIPILETKRLILRQYEESDLPEYHKLFSDKENMYYLNDVTTNTLEESRKHLKNAIEVNEKEKGRWFCIALKENNKLIGGSGYDITEETPVGKIADPLGWFIMPEFQNKGYMTEAVKKILEFAFLHDNCVRVVTGCYKDNIPTQKVMSKVGFRKEAEKIQAKWHDGKMKDRLELAINRDEYMSMVDDDNYCDFWIKELLPEYKFTGTYDFLREDKCYAAFAVAQSCIGQSRGFGGHGFGESEQWFHDWMKGDGSRTDSAILIHKIDDEIVGISCTCIYSHEHEKGAVVWERMLAVMPKFQGRGIARNLLMQTLQYGVEHGAKRAFLAVDLENKNAVKLYESIGFMK